MNVNQHVFVTEYLRHRNKILAYAVAYDLQSTADATTIESAANRLLRDPEIAEEIRKTYDCIRQEAEQDIAKEMRTELLTIHRKREILARIATGDIYVEQHYKGKNCSQCSQYIRPTINQMLKAIDLDSKLAGHYPQQARGAVAETPARTKEASVPAMEEAQLSTSTQAPGPVSVPPVNTQRKPGSQPVPQPIAIDGEDPRQLSYYALHPVDNRDINFHTPKNPPDHNPGAQLTQ